MNTQFNDRATYMEFRRNWKTAYKELSQDIRDTRRDIRQAYLDGKDERAGYLQAQKAAQRSEAHSMMVILTEAKITAQKQYMAEKTAKEAA